MREGVFGNLWAAMVKLLTGVLEVHILAVESVLQAVRHDLQLHYLLAYRHVWLGDVDFHLRVVDLTGQAVTHHFWKVPASTWALI